MILYPSFHLIQQTKTACDYGAGHLLFSCVVSLEKKPVPVIHVPLFNLLAMAMM